MKSSVVLILVISVIYVKAKGKVHHSYGQSDKKPIALLCPKLSRPSNNSTNYFLKPITKELKHFEEMLNDQQKTIDTMKIEFVQLRNAVKNSSLTLAMRSKNDWNMYKNAKTEADKLQVEFTIKRDDLNFMINSTDAGIVATQVLIEFKDYEIAKKDAILDFCNFIVAFMISEESLKIVESNQLEVIAKEVTEAMKGARKIFLECFQQNLDGTNIINQNLKEYTGTVKDKLQAILENVQLCNEGDTICLENLRKTVINLNELVNKSIHDFKQRIMGKIFALGVHVKQCFKDIGDDMRIGVEILSYVNKI